MRFKRVAAAAVAAGAVATLVAGGVAGPAGAAGAAPQPNPYGPDRAVPTGPAGSPSRQPSVVLPDSSVRWAIDQPACARPAGPSGIRCFAERRVTVAPGTAGAYPYSVAPPGQRGPAGGYTPHALATAYRYNPLSKKSRHQVIGIIDWYDDPYARKDLNIFDKHYKYHLETKQSFVKVNQYGAKHNYPKRNRGTSLEISLDLQAARAVCRKCKIILVEAKGPNFRALARSVNTAVRLGATVISNSYGAPETRGRPFPARFRRAYDHPGVVITASTGDHGWYSWDLANSARGHSYNVPNYPASDPNVVAVSGTALGLGKTSHRVAERVWNENGPANRRALRNGHWVHPMPFGAAGGGCSTSYKASRWQRGIRGYRAQGCKRKRSVTDVTAVGDPATGFDMYDTYEHGWVTIGGTSLSSPLIAAMWALAGGAHQAVHPSNSLYFASEILKRKASFDVVKGGTGFCGGIDIHTCSRILSRETTDGHGHHGNGNPNRLGNPSGHASGLKDCSFPYDGSKLARKAVRDPECNARPGFDGVAGVGAPKNLSLFHATNPYLHGFRPKRLVRGRSQRWRAQSKPRIKPDKIKYFTWSWGNGTHTRTPNRIVHHTYKTAGVYFVTLVVTDKYGQQSKLGGYVRVFKHGTRSAAGRTTGMGQRIPRAAPALQIGALDLTG